MADWYKNNYRRTLLDMHIEDWDKSFLSEFNPQDYFRQLVTAKVTAAMIYVQSHVGLCYWPTKTGIMHSAFEGKENQIKNLFLMCKEAGINTVLYYSVIYNNREYERHPDWRMKDEKGRSSREGGGRYGLCCPNNKEYQQFVKEQIKEFSEFFSFDGVFCDMTFWPEVCYCDSCKKRWKEKHFSELPAVIDWNNSEWLEFNRTRHEWISEFANMFTSEVKKYTPGATVEHQYGNSLSFWRFANNENLSLASDYIGTDLYGGIAEQSLACKIWYNLTQNQPFQYMTSRCFPALKEHTSTKSYDQLKQCVAMTYLHHGASLLIDAIDPVGTTDARVYEIFGEIYGDAQLYEPYMDKGKMAYDVSLYFNLNGKMDVEANGYHVTDHAADRDGKAGTIPHFDALMGAAKSLTRHHIPYSVINNWMISEIKNHKVLVLPDAPMMQEEEIAIITDYVKEGGNLYMSGHSAPILLENIFGIKWKGYTEENITYMAPTENSSVMRGMFTEKYPLVMFEKAVQVKGIPRGEVLATLTLPYTKPGILPSMFPTDISEEEYIDVNGESYPFSSIHANPPGINTNIPAMMKAAYGKGTVVWSSLPIEKAERYQHSDIFAGIIKMLAEDDFQFGADASESVECIMFDDMENKQKIMGIIETRELYHIPKTKDITVWIKSEKKPKAVYMLPGKTALSYIWKNGKVIITLEEIDIYCMFVVEYDNG